MDRIWRWIAWHVPRRLAYWTYIRVGVAATATTHRDTVMGALTMVDALESWSGNYRPPPAGPEPIVIPHLPTGSSRP